MCHTLPLRSVLTPAVEQQRHQRRLARRRRPEQDDPARHRLLGPGLRWAMERAEARLKREAVTLGEDPAEVCLLCFIDDVLVFSETWEDHLLHVALVLDRIGGAGFTFSPSRGRELSVSLWL